MARTGVYRIRINRLIVPLLVILGSVGSMADAQGFGVRAPQLTESEAKASINKRHLIVDENIRLVAEKGMIERLWTENQKLYMPEVLDDHEHQASICAGFIEDQFETIDKELDALSELLAMSAEMETDDDQITVSSAVWVHAKASRGTVGIFKIKVDHLSKKCGQDLSASKEFISVSEWIAATIPILTEIEKEASLLSGLSGGLSHN